jgi:hypothetical protein
MRSPTFGARFSIGFVAPLAASFWTSAVIADTLDASLTAPSDPARTS